MSSNLYKQRYFITEQTDSRIINSNKLIELRMKELARENQIAVDDQTEVTEFVEGIEAEEVPEEPKIDPEQLLEEARAQANQILADARNQATDILNEAEQQKQMLYEEQRKLGYESGAAELEQQLIQERAKLQEETDAFRLQLENEYQERQVNMESDLIDAIIEVFEHVFHIQFADKKEILFALVKNTILNVDAGKNFNIHVSGEDFAYVEEHIEEVKSMLGNNVFIEVTRDARIEPGACQIETNFGMFDCGIDTELDGLIRDIRTLAK